MPDINSVGNPPRGIEPVTRTMYGIPRGGDASKGEVWKLDLELSDADVSNFSIGSENSGLANLVAVDAAGVEFGILAIAAEDITEDTQGKWIVSGITDALVQKGSGNIAIGDVLVGTNGQAYLDADLTAGAKVIGRALEAVTGPSTGTDLARVWFDGNVGFGQHVS